MITPSSTTPKRIVAGFSAVLGMALAAFEAMPAQAAPPPHAPAWGYRRKQQQQPQRSRTYPRRTYTRSYPDLDRDGIMDTRDRDIDGDGILNTRDRQPRTYNRRTSSYRPRRAVPAGYYRDRNGRLIRRRPAAIPAGYYRDRNGRLIRRAPAKTINQHPVWSKMKRRSGDRDRDGIRNRRDRDLDGDGIRNRRDRDRDNDGVRNGRDRFDRRRNRR